VANGIDHESASRRRPPPPTVRQVYAIAVILASENGTTWPDTREEAARLLERLRAARRRGPDGRASAAAGPDSR